MGGIGSGRRAKPNSVRELEGNQGHRPLRDEGSPVVEQPGAPPMPDLCPVAAKEWESMTALLLSRGRLRPSDGRTLAAYCTLFARAEQCRKEIDRSTTISKRVERLIRMEDRALKSMRAFYLDFGLTPSKSNNLANDRPSDPFEDFLSRKPLKTAAQ